MSRLKLEIILKQLDDTNQQTWKKKLVNDYPDVSSFTALEITINPSEERTFNLDKCNILYIISEHSLEVKHEETDTNSISTGKICLIDREDGITTFYIKNLDTENKNALSINLIEY